jgi:hypothetical protein
MMKTFINGHSLWPLSGKNLLPYMLLRLKRYKQSSPRKAKGVKFRRTPTVTPHQQREARERVAAGETQCSIARSYNISQATIFRLRA